MKTPKKQIKKKSLQKSKSQNSRSSKINLKSFGIIKLSVTSEPNEIQAYAPIYTGTVTIRSCTTCCGDALETTYTRCSTIEC